ncbi:MAG: L,D-transpeptidase [Cyanobacteria bacterium J06627_28]
MIPQQQPSNSPKSSSPAKRLRQRWTTGALLVGCVATGYFLLSRLELMVPISQLPAVLCLPSCEADSSIHTPLPEGDFMNADSSLQDLLGTSNEYDNAQVSLLIEKGQHRVTLYYESQPIKSYEAVFGTAPIGDKRFEGDRKTPEGIFRIHDLYPHDEWSKFIWLDYPTPQSWRKHLRSKLSGEISLGTTIGGQIGIHGVPEGADGLIETRSDWTWGCISLKNSDVNEIYEFVTHGTVVEIVP